MEYSTMSMLCYYKDTLANVGLLEAILLWGSDCVTQLKNIYVKHESNRIEKLIESNQIVKAIKSNQINNRELNRVKNGDHRKFRCRQQSSRQ